MKTQRHEFIETIRIDFAAELPELLDSISGTKARAVVLICDKPFEFADGQFCKKLAAFPLPTILALKSSAAESFVDACHLCIAAEDARIGNFAVGEALKRGLINKIAISEDVENEALALAEKIAALAPLAVRACLKAVTEGAHLPLEEGLKVETELFAQIFSTADMREGTRAFLEKRKPVFDGK